MEHVLAVVARPRARHVLQVAGAVDEDHRRAVRLRRRVDARRELGLVARGDADDRHVEPWVRRELRRRRRGDLLRVDVELGRLVRVRVDVRDRAAVGRDHGLVLAGHRRQLRPGAAADRHPVEVALERAHLAGDQVERLLVARQLHGVDFEVAAGELLRRAAGERHGVEVHETGRFRRVEDRVVVAPPRIDRALGPADPGVVVQRHDRPALRRRRIEGHDPEVLVVGRADHDEGVLPVLGPQRRAQRHLALRRLLLFFALLRLLRRGRHRHPVLEPLHLAVRFAQHGDARRRLHVADFLTLPSGDRLHVSALGHVIRDDRPLGLLRLVGDDDHDGLAVGGEAAVGDRLLLRQLERLERMLALALGLVLLALLGAAGHDVEQLLLFLLHDLLAVRPLLVVPQRHVRALVVGAGHVRELRRLAAGEVDGEDVVRADERHPLLVEGEVRRRLAVGRLRDGAALPGRGVPQPDVALFAVDDALPVARAVAVRRRRVLLLLVRQLAQPAAVAVHDVCVAVLFERIAVLLPRKEHFRAVGRPADLLGRPADKTGAAHDVVDRQVELLRISSEDRGDADGKGREHEQLLHRFPPRRWRMARRRATALSMSA